MPVLTAAGLATGTGLMLDIVDFAITRAAEADTTRRLERIEDALADLDVDVAQLSDQLFRTAIAEVDDARDLLADYAPGDSESEREAAIEASVSGVNGVLQQAGSVIRDGVSFDQLVSTLNAVSYAVQTRMLVAATL
jgi:hypothetical protein